MGQIALDVDRLRYRQAHQLINRQYPTQFLSAYMKLLSYMQYHATMLSKKAQTNQTMLLAPNIDVCGPNSYMQKAWRSIGDNPDLVSLYAAVFAHAEQIAQNPTYTKATSRAVHPEKLAKPLPQVPGLYAANTVQVFKHYPGYGDAENTHFGSYRKSTLSAKELRDKHLAPFRAAILGGARAMMSNWVAYPSIEAGKKIIPAAYSKGLLTSTLRQQYGFDGVLITDALNMSPTMYYMLDKFQMKAPQLRERMTYEYFSGTSMFRKILLKLAGPMYEECLLAGNDMMFFFIHPADRNRIFAAIVNHVKKNQKKLLPRVTQSVARVLTLKTETYPMLMQHVMGPVTVAEYVKRLTKPASFSTLIAQTLASDYYGKSYERTFMQTNQIGAVWKYKPRERKALLLRCEKLKKIPPFFARDKLSAAQYSDATNDAKKPAEVEEGTVQDLGIETITDLQKLFPKKRIPAGFLHALTHEFLL